MIVAARLTMAVFKITSYVMIYCAQAMWFLAAGRRDKVGDAMGTLARGITDAFADIFRV